MRVTRVLIADDHAVVRAGVATLLRSYSDIDVVAECADGSGAADEAIRLMPDVAVLDFAMAGLNGADASERIARDCPPVKVLILSAHSERSCLTKALQAGAKGYVLKHSAADEFLRAVRAVAAGGVYLDPALMGHVVDGLGGDHAAGAAALTEALSVREGEVIRLIARGFTNREVASRLDVSIKTVETYKVRAMEKLALCCRVDLVHYAHARGWLDV